MRGLDYRLLGPLEVLDEAGARLELRGAQPSLVLARLLLAESRPVPADALVEAVWGDQPPDSATSSLQALVSRLRRFLGPDGGRLIYAGGGYRLEVEPDRVDVSRFERDAGAGAERLAAGDLDEASRLLTRAGAEWRGPLLAGLEADFAVAAAARLEQLRDVALEDRCEADLGRGEGAGLVAELTAAVQAAPLRERTRGLLARALYRAGRQAEALEELDRARRLLGEELGLDLSRELRDLQQRILAQDPSLDATVRPPRAPSQWAGGGAQLDRPTSTLVGRSTELRSVQEAIDATLPEGGSCRYLVVEGEPGIGKTRLAQEALQLAEHAGAITLSAGTLEGVVGPAYGPWLQLLREVRARSGAVPASVARLLDGHELGSVAPNLVAESVADGVAEALRTLAGDRGLALLLDDLQWADPASLELLGRLGPRLSGARVLLVATVRLLGIGQQDEVLSTLAQLTRHPGTARLTLRGLSLEECAQLLTRSTGRAVSDADVRVLHGRSDGNPFFATELARLVSEEGMLAGVPTGVHDVLARRVALLPEATATLLEVAAVIGRQVDVALLAHVADRPLEACLEDLEPALERRLLEVPAGGAASLRFPHALVRESLAEGITPLRRARLHLRTADAIEALLGDTDDTAEVLAEHLWAAAVVGAGARAAAALERGAEVALSRQALGSAYSLLERSAQLYRAAGGDSAEGELRVLRLLAFVEGTRLGYRAARRSPHSQRAKQMARAAGRPELLIDILWTEWAGCDTGGEPERAMELVEEAQSVIEGLPDVALEASVTAMRAFSLRHQGRMAESHRESLRGLELFVEAGARADAAAYLNSSLTLQGYQFFAAALVTGHDEVEFERVFRTHELPFGQMVIAMFGGATALVSGDVDALRRWTKRMRQAETDVVMSFWTGSVEVYTALAQLHDGDLRGGQDRLATGLGMMADAQATAMVPGVLAEAARALVQHDETAQARTLVDEARRVLAEHGELCYEPLVLLATADVTAAEGDPAGATSLAREAFRVAGEQGSHRFAQRVVAAYPER